MAERPHRTGRRASRVPFGVSILALVAWSCAGLPLPPLPEFAVESFAEPVKVQLEAARASAETAPLDAGTVGDLGKALYAYGQQQPAALCFERCRILEPEVFEWAYLLAVVLADLGQLAAADAAFGEAEAMRPRDLPTVLRRADLAERSGNAVVARALLDAALQIDPESSAVRFRMGRLAGAENASAAVEHLRAALAVEPDYREALYALAGAYRALGRDSDADRQLALYEETDPSPRRHYQDPLIDALDAIRGGTVQEVFNDGYALQQAGKSRQALAAYSGALEIDPEYVQAHVNLVAVYGELGDHERAASHYRRSLELDPTIAEAHYNYGVSRHFAEDFEGAAEAFEKALAINPQHADAHSNLGTALDALGRTAEADRHYRNALEQNPSHPMANFHVGRRLAEAGQYRRALPYLETAAGTESEGTALHAYLLALVLRQMGEAPRSRESARLALEHALDRGALELAARIRSEFDL